MRTMEIQMPEPIFKQVQQLAMRENMPVDQVLSLALTQGVASWMDQSQFEADQKAADRERFLDALSGALLAGARA